MITARPLSRFLRHITIALVVLVLGVALVSLSAIWMNRNALDQFRQEVGRSVDAVSALSLDLADAQNALMLAASTYNPVWPRVAEESMAELAEAVDALDDVSAVTGNTATTARASAHVRSWLSAADEVLNGGFTAKSVATVEYPLARASLMAVADELAAEREERRAQHDAIILGGAVAIITATLAALVFVGVMSRHYVRRLATPLDQLRDMVDARVAGDLAVRARTDQGFSEATRLAHAINELSDSNNAFRVAQEATIHSHLVAERVASDLAGDSRMWVEALQVLHDELRLDAVALIDARGDVVASFPADARLEPPTTAHPPTDGVVSDVTVVPLLLGGQSLGSLRAQSPGRRWSSADAETLEMCSNHFAASLALQEVIETRRQLDEDKSRFMATTSHELRTPLTAVVAWLSMFADGDLGTLTEEQQLALGVVDRNVGRLRDLIEDLLTLNQLDSGHARAVRTRLDVGAITQRVVENLLPMANRAEVRLTHDMPAGDTPGECLGDPVQIERAITNIVSNAIKFTGRGGEAQVTTRSTDDAITVTCRDTGIGIPLPDLPHVLERFRRAGNAHGLPGTGLGLSIVHSIMEAHGGSFQLESTEGRGTRITLTLPHTEPATVTAA